MSLYTKEEKKRLKELDEQLTTELSKMIDEVLVKFSKEKEKNCSVHSLHGTIGSKNNTYVDSIHSQFSDPTEFKAKWIDGFFNDIAKYSYSPLKNLLKDETFRAYTLIFLERNFYRNLLARTRSKPNENLWTIWLGSGNLIWGVIIAPVYRENIWTNDVSEVRRANYMYWTIGHILSTGLIDPENNLQHRFSNLEDLIMFYQSVLKRVSNSAYEKQIFDLYVEYLKKSKNIPLEPFLIPELRYAGLEIKHEYRLDFTVLNPHTMEMIGFELSPHSSHMAVSKIKDRKQIEINNELNIKWNKEMAKRNKYFSNYGITIITFTDEDLLDIPNCFKTIELYLAKRPENKINLDDQIARLKDL